MSLIFCVFTTLSFLAQADSPADLFRANTKSKPDQINSHYRTHANLIHRNEHLSAEQKESLLKDLNVARQEFKDTRKAKIFVGSNNRSLEEMCELDLFGREDKDPAEGIWLLPTRLETLQSYFTSNSSFGSMLNESLDGYIGTLRASLDADQRIIFDYFVYSLAGINSWPQMFEICPRGRLHVAHASLDQVAPMLFQIEHVRQLVYGGESYAAKYQSLADFRDSRAEIANSMVRQYLSVIPASIFRTETRNKINELRESVMKIKYASRDFMSPLLKHFTPRLRSK